MLLLLTRVVEPAKLNEMAEVGQQRLDVAAGKGQGLEPRAAIMLGFAQVQQRVPRGTFGYGEELEGNRACCVPPDPVTARMADPLSQPEQAEAAALALLQRVVEPARVGKTKQIGQQRLDLDLVKIEAPARGAGVHQVEGSDREQRAPGRGGGCSCQAEGAPARISPPQERYTPRVAVFLKFWEFKLVWHPPLLLSVAAFRLVLWSSTLLRGLP